MGGHCLPVDPFYLSWRAREFDMATEFIELAGKVNQQMPYHCVAKAQRALNDAGLSVKGARIAVLGVELQAGRGRHARVARAEDHLAAAASWARTSATTTRTCPSLAELRRSRARRSRRRSADADLALIVTAHPERRPRADRAARAAGGRPARRHASAHARRNVVRL